MSIVHEPVEGWLCSANLRRARPIVRKNALSIRRPRRCSLPESRLHRVNQNAVDPYRRQRDGDEQRAHEIGIRLALGAKRRQIMGLIIGRGLRLSMAGAVLGTAGGVALTRYLKSLLYGVTPHDLITLAAGIALVIVVALAAAYFPARRAVQQDPMATLRLE